MNKTKTYRIPVLLANVVGIFLMIGGLASLSFISLILSYLTGLSFFGLVFSIGILSTGMFWMLLNQSQLFKNNGVEITIGADDIETDIDHINTNKTH